MKLLDACKSAYGDIDGIELYTEIIEECEEAINECDPFRIEEILHDNGFEPDYILDVLDSIQ